MKRPSTRGGLQQAPLRECLLEVVDLDGSSSPASSTARAPAFATNRPPQSTIWLMTAACPKERSAEDRGQGCHGHVGDGDAICGVGGSGDSSDLDRRGLSVGARAPPDQAVSQRALRDRHRVVSVAVALDRRERRAGGERGWIVEHLDESALDRVVALEVYDGACHGDRAGGDRVDEVRAEAGVVGRLARRIGLIVRAEVRDTSSPKTRTGRSARSRATHSPRPPTVVDAFAFSLSSPSFRLASPSLRPRPRLAHLRLALTFAPATPSPSPSSSRSSPSGCYRCHSRPARAASHGFHGETQPGSIGWFRRSKRCRP